MKLTPTASASRRGLPATEDLAAADVIRASFGIRTTSMTALLEKLGTDGTWNEAEVAAALGSWRSRRRS